MAEPMHPSPCLTTADVLHLGGSPWSRTRGRCSSSGNSSALAGDQRQGGLSPTGAVLTPPAHIVRIGRSTDLLVINPHLPLVV